MSGGLSIPFAFLAAFDWRSARWTFAVLAFIALLVAMCRVAYRAAELRRPKISTACGKAVSGSRGLNIGVDSLRIVITSLSEAPITNCQAHLTEIKKGKETFFCGSAGGNSVHLTFCPSDLSDPRAITIFPSTYPAVDVVYVKEKGEVLPGCIIGGWNFDKNFAEIFAESGEYFLTVKIVGDMPTEIVNLKFTRTTNWKTSTLEKVTPFL
jgi:hypothetical protein